MHSKVLLGSGLPEGHVLCRFYTVEVLIGLHPIEPFLSLTTSTSTTWAYTKLIPAFHQLYDNLIKTDPTCPKNLLDINTLMHNSTIVSMDSFQHTKYDDDICNAISFPDETTKMIQVILPEFASKRQKGDIFHLGTVIQQPNVP